MIHDLGLKIWAGVFVGVIAGVVWINWPPHKPAATTDAVPAMPRVQLTMSSSGDPKAPPDHVLLRFPDDTVEWYERAKEHPPMTWSYDADCAFDTSPPSPMCVASKP